MVEQLTEKIGKREAVVGIIGMGYVGLPLVIEFHRAGFGVIGFDIDETKVAAVFAGNENAAGDESEVAVERRTAIATTEFEKIRDCDAVLICVSTPLDEHREPDLQFVRNTAYKVGANMRPGQLVVLESTTYPGTTEEVLIPILEAESGLKCGEDFYAAYSPEREDPNNQQYSTSTIPKVVGGADEGSLQAAQALYDSVISSTVAVPDCRTAEATKLMENIFRCVNIALVNELKTVFEKMDIDVWEVVRAASTKPFGYMPFYPGPGLGGHCIPIDPYYLSWKAREYAVPTRFIEVAGEVNAAMPQHVMHTVLAAANNRGMTVNGARVLLVGLAYKKNVDDDRESPTYVLWEEFEKLGGLVDYYDPYCPEVRPGRSSRGFAGNSSVSWDTAVAGGYDIAVIATDHDDVDYGALAGAVPLVVDTRNACPDDAENVVKA